MERLDDEGRSSVCTTDSLRLHHSGKPGKADFIAKMRPVAVIRSEDAFNALHMGEQKSHWLASLIVRKFASAFGWCPITGHTPTSWWVTRLGTQTRRPYSRGDMTFAASWEILV